MSLCFAFDSLNDDKKILTERENRVLVRFNWTEFKRGGDTGLHFHFV
jgi:hypothetical protein